MVDDVVEETSNRHTEKDENVNSNVCRVVSCAVHFCMCGGLYTLNVCEWVEASMPPECITNVLCNNMFVPVEKDDQRYEMKLTVKPGMKNLLVNS